MQGLFAVGEGNKSPGGIMPSNLGPVNINPLISKDGKLIKIYKAGEKITNKKKKYQPALFSRESSPQETRQFEYVKHISMLL